jgi:Lar family restriction alleviation protein
MEEIKACPFCGKNRVNIHNYSEVDGKIKWSLIHICRSDTCELDNMTTISGESLEDVVESWNRRVQG